MPRDSTIYIGVAVAIALYLGHMLGAFTRFPGLTLDARFNQVVLEHLWQWATGRADSLSDPGFFYPYRDILYLSDTHFGSGWIYMIARALGAPREIAFDFWFLAGMASTYAAALYVFRRFGLSSAAAVLGACLFAFSLPMLAQDNHAQLVYRFAVPLATLACAEFIRAPNLRSLAALALWVSWQFLCSVYVGVFLIEWLAIFAPLTLLAGASAQPAPAWRSRDFALIAASALAVGLAAFMLWRHAETARAFAIHRDIGEISGMAPTWVSLLSMEGAKSVAWMARFLPELTYRSWEHQLFPGFGVLLLAIAGVWFGRENRAVIIACLVGIAGLLLLALDFGGWGLYRYVAEVPGLNAIRSPGRVALVVAFPLAWLAALGLDALRRQGSPTAIAALTVGLALSLLDIATFRSTYVEIPAARARVAAIAQGLDAEALRSHKGVLLRFGDTAHEDEAVLDVDLMIAAQDRGLWTINGYSGSIPPGFERPKDCAEARAWLKQVDALPAKREGADNIAARAVIVPPGACDPR